MSLVNQQKSLKYPLYLGSLTLVGGLAFLLYKKHISSNSNNSTLPRELVKKVLKDFKKHMYPLFYEIRMMSKNIQNQVRMQTKRVQIPPEYLDEIRQMITNGPNFKVKVEEIEDKVYQKNNIIDRKVFEQVALDLSKKDPEIKALMQNIRNIYTKSLNGESSEFDGVIPQVITSDILLSLRKQQIKNELDAFLTFCIQYEQMHGKINPQDPQFSVEMEEALKESDKLFILPDIFNCSDDYLPLTIYQEAIKKQSVADAEFSKNMVQLENFKSQIMRKSIYQGNLTGTSEELKKIDQIGIKQEPLIKEVQNPQEILQEPLEPEVINEKDNIVEQEIVKIEEKIIDEELQKQQDKNDDDLDVVEEIENLKDDDNQKKQEIVKELIEQYEQKVEENNDGDFDIHKEKNLPEDNVVEKNIDAEKIDLEIQEDNKDQEDQNKEEVDDKVEPEQIDNEQKEDQNLEIPEQQEDQMVNIDNKDEQKNQQN